MRKRLWDESTLFAFIFCAGTIFFLIHLCTWAIPQLTLIQEFVPVEGVILETRLREKPDALRPAWRPELLLEYSIEDVVYRTWTFDLNTLSPKEGFLHDKNKAVQLLAPFSVDQKLSARYRVGHPEQVIVVWKSSFWGWFLLFFWLALALLSLVGFCLTFRLSELSRERKAARLAEKAGSLLNMTGDREWPCVPDIRIINESPGTRLAYRLPLGNRPIFPLLGITLFGIAWNAVAWGVMFHSFLNPAENWWDQIIGIILRGLFCGVGVMLFAWIIHQILLAFSIGPTLLEISDHPIYPGRRYRIQLNQSGTLRFREMTVSVVCEEIARFRQGTDTVTNRKEVFKQILFQRTDFETSAALPLEHEFFLELPLGAMHSFRQENNEIFWKLLIHSAIIGWPNLDRECPIIVRPDLTENSD